MRRIGLLAVLAALIASPAQAATTPAFEKLVSPARLVDRPLTARQAQSATLDFLHNLRVTVAGPPHYRVSDCKWRTRRAINCWAAIWPLVECDYFAPDEDLFAPCPPDRVVRFQRTYAVWVTAAYGRVMIRERWSSETPR